jgi:hypothetical protein
MMKTAVLCIVVIIIVIAIVILAISKENYGAPVADGKSPMRSGWSPSYNYHIQHPRMVCPTRPLTAGCLRNPSHFEHDYPVWGRDKFGDQRMRVGGGLSGDRWDPYHIGARIQGNLNPSEYKLYGWRHHQYSGDPFYIHRWYNNPNTMSGIWKGESIFTTNDDCLFADESLPSAIARAGGYNDNVDNEGVDGNFHYPDSVGNHTSNYYQTYSELA